MALRVEWTRDVVRDRSALAVAARAPHQRSGDGRNADDRGLGQGPRRSARAAATAPTISASRRSCGKRTSSISSPCWSSTIRTTQRSSSTNGSRCHRPSCRSSPPGRVQPFASVRDDHGGDVSDLAAARDSRYVDFAGRGPYQGITRAHFVEMELPDDGPADRPALARRRRVDPSDRQLDQRRDWTGRACRARGPVAARRRRRRPLP